MSEENEITLREWLENYKNKKYALEEGDDVHEKVCDIGWYDWFCGAKSLINRTKKFYSIARKITNDFILDNYYVWFKNNCPVGGPLYDDMRFEPMNEELREKMYFLLIIDCCWYKKYAISTARNNYKVEFETDDKNEMIAYINNLDFSKEYHASIDGWMKFVEENVKTSPQELTYSIIGKSLHDKIFEMLKTQPESVWSPVLLKLFEKTVSMYKICREIKSEAFKNSTYVSLKKLSEAEKIMPYDEYCFQDMATNKLKFILRVDFPFSRYNLENKEYEDTEVGAALKHMDEVIKKMTESYPKDDIKYSLFIEEDKDIKYIFGTDTMSEVTDKINELTAE